MRKPFLILIYIFLIHSTGYSKTAKGFPYIDDIDLTNYLENITGYYVIDGITAKNQTELVTLEYNKENALSFKLYAYNDHVGKWFLILELNTWRTLTPISYTEYIEKPLILSNSIIPDEELIALDVDGIPGKEILVPVIGATYEAIQIYKINYDGVIKIAEIEGCYAILEHNGKIALIGHKVTDWAFLSLTDKVFHCYTFENGKLTMADTFPDDIYQTILNDKLARWSQKKNFINFYMAFIFQYANGHEAEARQWFEENKKLIIDKNEYFYHVEDYFIKQKSKTGK